MAVHKLKIYPSEFLSTYCGTKKFEYRKDDRDPRFAVHDILILEEYDPENGYTGHQIRAEVTYVLRGKFGVPMGWCVMSIHVLRN